MKAILKWPLLKTYEWSNLLSQQGERTFCKNLPRQNDYGGAQVLTQMMEDMENKDKEELLDKMF